MEKSKNKKIIQVVLQKGSPSSLIYYADNQTISDDYLNQNFKVVYMPS
jgi:hypothetical protein